MKDEVILCQCLWPAVIYQTTTGHEFTCPVEQIAIAEKRVEFLKIIGESDDPNLAALANRDREKA